MSSSPWRFTAYLVAAVVAGGAAGAIASAFYGARTERTISVTPSHAAIPSDLLVPFQRPGPLVRPTGWPTNMPWRPNRHFGPFFHGSELADIQLRLHGPNTAQWFYNDFFVAHPDLAIYSKYFPLAPPVPPASSAPAPVNFPGGTSGFAGTAAQLRPYDMMLRLDRLRYTSKYGGSIELRFLLDEDYMYEAQEGNYLWDFSEFEMLAYLVPATNNFNPVLPANPTVSAIYVEFVPSGAVAYDAATRVRIEEPQLTTARAALDAALRAYAIQLVGSGFTRPPWVQDAHRLMYGFIHSEFQAEVLPTSSTDKVVSIDLADDHIDLHTADREAIFILRVRLEDVYVYGADTFGDAEIIGFLSIRHIYRGGTTLWHYEFYPGSGHMSPHESTGWMAIATFRLPECQYLERINAVVFMNDEDIGNQQDLFETKEFSYPVSTTSSSEAAEGWRGGTGDVFTVSCADIQSAYGQTPPKFGVLRDYHNLLAVNWRDGDPAWGSFTMHSVLELTAR